MADITRAVQASKLMDLVRAAQAYDYANRPRPGNWTQVSDQQAARLIVGALSHLLSDLGDDEEASGG